MPPEMKFSLPPPLSLLTDSHPSWWQRLEARLASCRQLRPAALSSAGHVIGEQRRRSGQERRQIVWWSHQLIVAIGEVAVII